MAEPHILLVDDDANLRMITQITKPFDPMSLPDEVCKILQAKSTNDEASESIR